MTSPISSDSQRPSRDPAVAMPVCVCGGSSYHRVRGPYDFLGTGPRFEVVACDRCRLARTAPPPYDNELEAEIYQGFAHEAVFDREAQWRGFFTPLLDAARRYHPTGRLLDVGCGIGLAVRMADELGYEGWGVEIDRRTAAYARDTLGLRVVSGDLASAGFPNDHFSVVILSHVLEHLSMPQPVFDEIRRVLAPDGVVVIDVPNMAGLLVPLLGAKWQGWMPNMHVWQFTPASLRVTLRRMGWETVEVTCRDNIFIGDPPSPLKRLVRRTAFRAMERTASALDRADKVLCVARARPRGAAA